MRVFLAIAAAVLVLSTGAAPHVHDGQLGSHGCVACVAAGGDAARPSTPDVAPRGEACGAVALATAALRAAGFPQGAVPGQSPPPA